LYPVTPVEVLAVHVRVTECPALTAAGGPAVELLPVELLPVELPPVMPPPPVMELCA
jgi:hypothetical protein